MKKWTIQSKLSTKQAKELKDYSDLEAQLLVNRDVATAEEAEAFLKPDISHLHDPFLIHSMDVAVKQVEEAIDAGKKIIIHGDFDADGVSASVILWEYLFRDRGADATPYIPHRVDEGYGLTEKSLTAIKDLGAELVITVDCGIRDKKLIEKWSKKGLEFIVTDHHDLPEELPDIEAIVHPRHPKGEYPHGMLSGGAVAWKLVAAMEKERLGSKFAWDKVRGFDLAALSTVCDVMPLRAENRVITRFGLEKLRKTQRPGLKALYQEAGVDDSDLDPYRLGFVIGPRLNAAGRLGHAIDSVKLLATEDESVALKLALKLSKMNSERQKLTDEVLAIARDKIETQGKDKKLYFVTGNDWPEGVIGLVAGKIMEEFSRPTIIVSVRNGIGKASARSIDGFNMIGEITKFEEMLVRYGGHELAAGFDIEEANIGELAEKLEKIADEVLKEEDLIGELKADMKIDPVDVNWDLFDVVKKFEPLGYRNPAPRFVMEKVAVLSCQTMGSDGSHLKLILDGGKSGRTLEAVGFGMGEWAERLGVGSTVDILFSVEENVWNGDRRLQVRLKDIREGE